MVAVQEWYAHTSIEADAPETWQPLEEHLSSVAQQAEKFASSFGYGRWGYTLGILHDIGKATEAFQARLRGSCVRVDHASPGARIACEHYQTTEDDGLEGMLLAYAIAGHHGGIPNGTSQSNGERKPLKERLRDGGERGSSSSRLQQVLCDMGLTLFDSQDLEPLGVKSRCSEAKKRGCSQQEALEETVFSLSTLCRMLYSCLVDADYLDTEQFMTPDAASLRQSRSYDPIEKLVTMLDAYLDRLEASAPDTPVNRSRAAILRDCRESACADQGLFTLTVPTGGGKTLSAMAFALRHALAYGCDRVIYVSPFTSITSQTADVFRSVFGEANVLEHHSNYDFERLGDKQGLRHRLAVQNWDSPIIVTTNVQLFESLFSNKPGKCRKLHNTVHSVIILDEAQSLPDGLLTATLAMLEELTFNYGVSVVLCTATQPALEDHWPFGSHAREIVRDRSGFDEAFGRRTKFEYLRRITEEALADDIAALDQALCIVGTKAKARSLYEAVKCRVRRGDLVCMDARSLGLYHLSANMTPLHRTELLDEIRNRLRDGSRCVVISTQLIEAGVDVDFPNVYRELAGLDSLFQAAGRCNREGRRDVGTVRVFEIDDAVSPGQGGDARSETVPLARTWLERMKGIARMLIAENGGVIDERLVKPFFNERYGFNEGALDAREIYRELTDSSVALERCRPLRMETVARRYRIIDNTGKTVFVPWGEGGKELLRRLQRSCEAGGSPAAMASLLQRSSISVRSYVYDALEQLGVIDSKTFYPISVLQPESDCSTFYSNEVGLLESGEEENNELIF